jgi:hypothetical protein
MVPLQKYVLPKFILPFGLSIFAVLEVSKNEKTSRDRRIFWSLQMAFGVVVTYICNKQIFRVEN